MAVKQVPGKRDCHSSQRATDGGKGQHLGSSEGWDKIPVEFGKAGMSQRSDRAVLVSGAELRVECPARAASGTPKYSSPLPTLPQGFQQNPFFFQGNCTRGPFACTDDMNYLERAGVQGVARSHTGSGEAACPKGAPLAMFLESWLPASLLPQGWEECRDHLLCAPRRV